MRFKDYLIISALLISAANRNFIIHKVIIVSDIDSIIIPDTTLIALFTERLPHKTEFIVIAKNLKDKSGNYLDSTKTVCFYFNGFALLNLLLQLLGWNE